MNLIKLTIEKYWLYLAVWLVLLIGTAVFDRALALGLALLSFLSIVLFLVFYKLRVLDKKLAWLFFIALLIHIIAVLFISSTGLQFYFSKGAGDYGTYHKASLEVYKNFQQGNFALDNPVYSDPALDFGNFYPVIIGVIYVLTAPEMIIGQLFSAWLAAFSIVLAYLIMIELGASSKWAFRIGLVMVFYPSFLFYGSLLLKDSLVVLLTLLAIFFLLRLIKLFLWRDFIIFYAILIPLTHFRFYIGYALILSFIFCALFLMKIKPLAKKIIYLLIIIIVMGFVPDISAKQGYYGTESFARFFEPEMLSHYQQDVYKPEVITPAPIYTPVAEEGPADIIIKENKPADYVPLDQHFDAVGFDSTWEKEEVNFKDQPLKFLINQIKYFLYVLLGPLPWQIKKPLHLLALFELIPWYILLFFVGKGTWQAIKNRNNLIITIIIFSVLFLGVMSLFFNNFGVITRIRIPVFALLLCLIPLCFKKYDFFEREN